MCGSPTGDRPWRRKHRPIARPSLSCFALQRQRDETRRRDSGPSARHVYCSRRARRPSGAAVAGLHQSSRDRQGPVWWGGRVRVLRRNAVYVLRSGAIASPVVSCAIVLESSRRATLSRRSSLNRLNIGLGVRLWPASGRSARNDEAVAHLSQAVSRDPKRADAQLYLGLGYLERGDEGRRYR
jgi:hypothetical protein